MTDKKRPVAATRRWRDIDLCLDHYELMADQVGA
jgi:hypothetical protein